ncbi:hypothetical protein AVEN_162372-1 [Araneus ventricosus]|uniref:Uncharacterized protein n=1 Tax=Araneus ventricosus TaxID=182803 RepID=A0A4Y2GJH2_ARAVE|nr:hypothetical protein AVEN_162372-1 [Araneus ventricosus]
MERTSSSILKKVKEWASLGITENDPIESSSSSRYHEHYLPHRPVAKQQGTTKVHPVFDAAGQTSWVTITEPVFRIWT